MICRNEHERQESQSPRGASHPKPPEGVSKVCVPWGGCFLPESCRAETVWLAGQGQQSPLWRMAPLQHHYPSSCERSLGEL